MAVSSQGMQDHLGAKSANWLCCQLHFQFPDSKPQSEVDNFYYEQGLSGSRNFRCTKVYKPMKALKVIVVSGECFKNIRMTGGQQAGEIKLDDKE